MILAVHRLLDFVAMIQDVIHVVKIGSQVIEIRCSRVPEVVDQNVLPAASPVSLQRTLRFLHGNVVIFGHNVPIQEVIKLLRTGLAVPASDSLVGRTITTGKIVVRDDCIFC